MIKQVEFYHGAVLARLVRGSTSHPVTIRAYDDGRGCCRYGSQVGFIGLGGFQRQVKCFKFDRCHLAERALATPTVIGPLDPRHDGELKILSRFPTSRTKALDRN